MSMRNIIHDLDPRVQLGRVKNWHALVSAASTLNRILTGMSCISPEMALRFSKARGHYPENWLAMQYNHDLWHAQQHVRLGKVGKVRLTAA